MANRIVKSSLPTWLTRPKAPKTMAVRPQKFDYLLPLDFEATCERDTVIQPQESIEFPCLKINTITFEIESEFHRYVRPVHNPTITGFCTELTGIIQGMVENEKDFPETLDLFKDWMRSEGLREGNFAFVTCGDWDLKTCFPNQCKLSGVEVPSWSQEWINLKKAYHHTMGSYPRHVIQLLEGLDLKFVGRQHSGIADTRNIAAAVKALASKGHIYDITTKSKP